MILQTRRNCLRHVSIVVPATILWNSEANACPGRSMAKIIGGGIIAGVGFASAAEGFLPGILIGAYGISIIGDGLSQCDQDGLSQISDQMKGF